MNLKEFPDFPTENAFTLRFGSKGEEFWQEYFDIAQAFGEREEVPRGWMEFMSPEFKQAYKELRDE